MLKQFKLKVLIFILREMFELREVTAVAPVMSKKFGHSMHSDVYKFIWFKLDMLIDTAEFYSLILV